MQDFMYYIPTKVYLGRDQVEHLADLKEYGTRVLLAYGGGSIKRIGLYDRVKKALDAAGLSIVAEVSGIAPNPRLESVYEGVRLCRENHVDVVLAVGGGSVMDCAKIIAAGAVYDGDAWDLVMRKVTITNALPIATVPTAAATGSEMDDTAVISKPEDNLKQGVLNPWLRPKLAIMEPEATFSVPAEHTAAGIADIMTHVMEVYFNPFPGAYLQSRMCEAVLDTCIHYSPIVMEHPDDYDARANLFWSSSLAINGLLAAGCKIGWSAHFIDHELGAFYDLTHGVGMAITMPAWMAYVLSDATAPRLAEFAVNVWGVEPGSDLKATAREGIARTRAFFRDVLHLPVTLTDVGIGPEHFQEMAEKAAKRLPPSWVPLTADQVVEILKSAL